LDERYFAWLRVNVVLFDNVYEPVMIYP
jgi:hypothetical protein